MAASQGEGWTLMETNLRSYLMLASLTLTSKNSTNETAGRVRKWMSLLLTLLALLSTKAPKLKAAAYWKIRKGRGWWLCNILSGLKDKMPNKITQRYLPSYWTKTKRRDSPYSDDARMRALVEIHCRIQWAPARPGSDRSQWEKQTRGSHLRCSSLA